MVVRDLSIASTSVFFFFFQAEDGIRDLYVTGVQTCALPILRRVDRSRRSFARVFGYMECFGSEVECGLSGFVVKGFFLVGDARQGAELVVDAEASQVKVEFAIDGQQFVVGASDDLDFYVLKLVGVLR